MNDLGADVAKHVWFHSIDFGDGVVSAGMKSRQIVEAEAEAVFAGFPVAGASILDVGAWNGFFSFEAKRRGAARVLATDSYVWSHPTYRGKETFDLAREALRLDV